MVRPTKKLATYVVDPFLQSSCVLIIFLVVLNHDGEGVDLHRRDPASVRQRAEHESMVAHAPGRNPVGRPRRPGPHFGSPAVAESCENTLPSKRYSPHENNNFNFHVLEQKSTTIGLHRRER